MGALAGILLTRANLWPLEHQSSRETRPTEPNRHQKSASFESMSHCYNPDLPMLQVGWTYPARHSGSPAQSANALKVSKKSTVFHFFIGPQSSTWNLRRRTWTRWYVVVPNVAVDRNTPAARKRARAMPMSNGLILEFNDQARRPARYWKHKHIRL